MIDISVSNVRKDFGAVQVLRGVSFDVQAGEHIGLLGANGAGKSTLFRILTGLEKPDDGVVSVFPGKRLGLLTQLPEYAPGTTVRDVLNFAFAPLHAMQAELDELSSRLENDAAMRRYGELAHRFEAMGGFDAELSLRRVRNGLSIGDELFVRPMDTLSGGERTRVNLARLILEDTDILLLDEPTNHLDMRSTQWLEEYLSRYRGTVLVISHDRYFLDVVVGRVIEIENGAAVLYSGNYSFFVLEKRRRFEERLEAYEREKREFDRLQAVARRMHDYAGKNAKLHRQAFSIEKRAERLRRTERPKTERGLKGSFSSAAFSADDVLRLQDLSKAYGEKKLFSDITLRVGPGERIALLGDNGTGKTTFFNILTGALSPDAGRVQRGPSVKAAYLPQHIDWPHPERTLYDTMLYETGCTAQQARDRLGLFHFRGDDVFKTVEMLSGGERSRLKLCTLMGEHINLLLLDEPTNHLDIASREWMEEAVESFGEALLFISHDRYFIARFATRVWLLAGGRVLDFPEGYGQYTAYLAEQSALRVPEQTVSPVSPTRKPEQRRRADSRVRALESQMASLERREADLETLLSEHESDAETLVELLDEKSRVMAEWNAAFEQWEALQ